MLISVVLSVVAVISTFSSFSLVSVYVAVAVTVPG